MKKMTFALACASTLALFATDFSVATFEAFAEGASVGAKDDAGSDSGNIYWQYKEASSSTDGSAVKEYGKEGNLNAPTGPSLSGTSDKKYLELSTEGGTLWRSFNANAADLGAAKDIPADKDGLFIDTMVQFTATEDGGDPEISTEDKLAIWLAAEEGKAPVLCVKGCALTTEGSGRAETPVATPTTFKLTGADIQAGAWYRLTVRAIKNIVDQNEYEGDFVSGFVVCIDGKPLSVADPATVCDSKFTGYYDGGLTGDAAALIAAGQFIPSLKGYQNEDQSALQAVGFKGSGAIDDLVLTDENPLPKPAPEASFTIATADGVTAAWATSPDGEFTTYAEGQKAPAGKIYVKLATADGGVKIVEQTIAADGANAIDLTSMTANDWSWYLGDADADGAFIVDDATELKNLAAKLEALGSAGITFKLGADIDMSDAGVFPGIGQAGAENIAALSNAYFQGTFDGDHHTISNLKMTNASKGTGLFNTICGAAKIMNVTVDTVTYENMNANKVGGAMLVGIMSGGTIEGCTTKGSNGSSTMPITYNASGIINRIESRLGAVTVKDCTNEAAIYCVYSKIAGICPIVELSAGTGDVTFENCVNKGAIVGVGTDKNSITGKTPGEDGVAGIVAYAQNAASIHFKNCKNEGTLTGSRCGGILAVANSGTFIDEGGNQTKADVPAIKSKGGTITGFAFATVVDGVATYVADTEAKNGADLKVMLAGKTVTLAKGESITLDMTIATAEVVAADAENDKITQSGNVYTCEAKVIAVTPVVTLSATTAEFSDTLALPTVTVEGDYVENTDYTVAWDKALPTENPAEDVVLTATVTMTGKYSGSATATFTVTPKATVTYPEYIKEADKGKYDAWVAANGVTDRVDTDKALQAAYLLNVAPAEAEAEADKFAITSITIDAEGNVKVEAPAKNSKGADFNGTVEIQGAETLEGTWAPKAAGHKFFKAVLK